MRGLRSGIPIKERDHGQSERKVPTFTREPYHKAYRMKYHAQRGSFAHGRNDHFEEGITTRGRYDICRRLNEPADNIPLHRPDAILF